MSRSKTRYSRPGRIRRRAPKINLLAVKISLFVGLIMALAVSLVEFLFWDWSWIGTIVIIVVASSSAYAATVKHAAHRLDFVRSALKKNQERHV